MSAQRDDAERKRAEFYFEPFCELCPGLRWSGPFPSMAPMHSRDQKKPRTVYERAVQDFTETARRLARLNQQFRQASFAEFEMMMGFDDDEALWATRKPIPACCPACTQNSDVRLMVRRSSDAVATRREGH